MIINQGFQKIKSLRQSNDIFVILLVVLSSLGSFFIGKTYSITSSKDYKENNTLPITIEKIDLPTKQESTSNEISEKTDIKNTEGVYLGSKNGTKYHLPNCPGAKSILEENRIWFKSKDEAEKSGYSPASNCPGI